MHLAVESRTLPLAHHTLGDRCDLGIDLTDAHQALDDIATAHLPGHFIRCGHCAASDAAVIPALASAPGAVAVPLQGATRAPAADASF